jgi:hypothetical protein
MSKKSDIDRDLYERALTELQKLGVTATELMQRHPDCSKKKLAEIIGNRVTSRGLTMTLFEEARRQETVRSLARELLYRKIINEFPEGWFEEENVRSTVKLGSWHYDVLEFAPEYEESAVKILTALATTQKPDVGWKPTTADDERLRLLFETFWTHSA